MHIKKLIITACLLSMSLTGFSAAASVSILDHPTVAVPEFKNTGLISAEWENERDALNQAADIATDDLVNSGRFDVVERTQLKKILDEYALNNTGLVDQTTAVPIGHLTGAQYLLIGSINAVTARKSQTTIVGTGTLRYKVSADISVRMVDAETGRIVLAARGQGTEKNVLFKGPLHLIQIGTAEIDERQVSDAVRRAVDDAIDGPQGLIARTDGRAKVKHT